MKKVSVNYRLDPVLAENLDKVSKLTKISKTELLERALRIAMLDAVGQKKAELDDAVKELQQPPAKDVPTKHKQ